VTATPVLDNGLTALFEPMPKIPRLSRDMIVTEKIDGTNASVYIPDDVSAVHAASRTRWITVEQDNHGFARWVAEHQDELKLLGPGHHFGEWWGRGIQRGYGLEEKRFSLFNVKRWEDPATRPACVDVVPVLYRGPFSTSMVALELEHLNDSGSRAAPGFMQPEGVVVYHVGGNLLFKKTIEKDDQPKGR
jgi:hypothetical protein